MKTIDLTKDYYFNTEPDDDGNFTKLLLTEENDKVMLYVWEPNLDCEDFVCLAEGTLPVLKELVSSITWCYSHNRYEMGDIYGDALNVLVYKIFTQEEVTHLLQVFNKHFIVDLIEIMLAKGKLDYLKD